MYVGDNMGVGEILSYATGLKRSHFVQYHFISFVSILKLTVNFNVWGLYSIDGSKGLGS